MAIISAVEALGVAIIGGIITINRRKDEAGRAMQAEKDKARERRDACNYNLLFSVADGVEVLLEQAHGDEMNGNVDVALASVRHAKSECNRLYNEQVAKL